MKITEPSFKLAIICTILFLLHQIMQFGLSYTIEIADYYLDPLLMMPILLYLLSVEKRIKLQDSTARLQPLHLLIYFVLAASISEFLFPMLNPKFTADPLDVLAFGLGTLLFGVVQYISGKNAT